MLPYIVLITLPVLFQHINLKNGTIDLLANREKSNLAMKIFWVLLFFLLILRHETVGRDLPNYKYIYSWIANSDWEAAIGRSEEIGYSILNKLISLSINDFRGVLVVAAIISVWFTAKAYIKYSEDAVLSMALYLNVSCFIMLFSGLRQSIAMSIGFVAFEFTRKRKIWSFLIVVAIAMLFHTSAFMLVFMYPLYYIKIRRENVIFVMPILAMIYLFRQRIFSVLGAFLNYFTDYDTTIIETGAYTTLILFCIIAVFCFVIPDESKIDQDTFGMRSFLLFSIALQMFASLHSLAMRMNYYYIMFTPILVSRIIQCRGKTWSNVAIIARNVMVVFFILYFLKSAPEENALDTFPYRFFWESV